MVDDKVQAITPGGIKSLRGLSNEKILDVFYWLSPKYRQIIVQQICKLLNEHYAEFCAKHPHFAELESKKVSVLGHSLGSSIMFDVLAHQEDATNKPKVDADTDFTSPEMMQRGNLEVLRGYLDFMDGPEDMTESMIEDLEIDYPDLDFKVENLFMLGSPVPMFLTVHGIDAGDHNIYPKVENLYNIYHPYDPIAYRLEPWLSPKFKDTEPAVVPYWRRYSLASLFRSSSGISQLMGTRSTAPTPQVNFLGNRRYDYVVQLDASVANMAEYTSMLGAHSSYWGNKDVMFFMLCKICGIDENK